MSDVISVQLGEPGTTAKAFHYGRVSSRPFEDVVAALRAEIDGRGLKLLNEIDPQRVLAGLGRSIDGSRLLFFFHPNLVVRVMQTDWTAMVEAPLKLVVTELPDRTVSVLMADPAVAFGRYGNPELAEFGKELAATCQNIVEASI